MHQRMLTLTRCNCDNNELMTKEPVIEEDDENDCHTIVQHKMIHDDVTKYMICSLVTSLMMSWRQYKCHIFSQRTTVIWNNID